MNDKNKSEVSSAGSSKAIWISCALLLCAVVFAWLKSSSTDSAKDQEVSTPAPASAPAVTVAEVIDTLSDAHAVAKEKSRYKVLIVDENANTTSGVARIGDVEATVPDTRKGDVVVIELITLRPGGGEAVVVQRLASGQSEKETSEPPPVAAAPEAPADPATPTIVGQIFRGTVTGTSEEGDGIIKIKDHVVFVRGAELGQRVEFRITENSGPFARADVISNLTVKVSEPPAKEQEKFQQAVPKRKAPVKVGETLDVEVTESDRRNPGVDGVARIQNFVVFVPGTKIGDRVKIKITDVKSRAADSEVLERMDVTPATP